ncbi:MAG: hypothetical protein HY741_24170 [Chloroflexi bacterium]|nr:hypothetical protein [Chloroflexota bacterium]
MKSTTRYFQLTMLLLILAVFAAACASATPTPIPPTAVPPTALPTPTVASSSTAGQSGPLAEAMNKVKTAKTYRVDLNITGKGNFAATGGPTPEPGAEDKLITLLNMKGEVNGQNAHFAIQGMLTAFLGLAHDKPFEVISYNGTAYVKGPLPLLGATEEKWYQVPPEAAQVAQPPLTPASFLNSFGETGISPADFKLSGAESLDGKSCQVYAGDKSAVVNAFIKLGGATGATQEDLDSIDNAEFKFWLCDDGYLHQVKMLIEGHDKNKPEQKGTFEILMKLSDFDGSITITPPADATLLQLPEPPTQALPVTPTP